jgi:triacylglycerol lipase
MMNPHAERINNAPRFVASITGESEIALSHDRSAVLTRRSGSAAGPAAPYRLTEMGGNMDVSDRRLAPWARATRVAAALAAVFVVGLAAAAGAEEPVSSSDRRVVLLHGLIRSSRSMSVVADALEREGYRVCNVSYPSRHHSIEVLASDHVAPQVKRCFPESGAPIDFVTHSMGGIIVRQMVASAAVSRIGRVVMFGPPNGGSEIVDELGSWWLFGAINGPAGRELGTTADSVPKRLGPATFEVGIIAGNRPRNWLLARYLPGLNDGKVSVASAALDGMKDFVVMDLNHTFMIRDRDAIAQTVRFLRTGAFDKRAVADASVASTLPAVLASATN